METAELIQNAFKPKNYDIAYDVEFFLSDTKTGEVIPAEFLMKKEDMEVINEEISVNDDYDECQYSSVELDGMAIEVKTTSPFSCREELIGTLGDQIVNLRYPSHKVYSIIKDFNKADPKNKILGCDPDYNVYTGKRNSIPSRIQDQPVRTVGGHIHIGICPKINGTLTNTRLKKSDYTTLNLAQLFPKRKGQQRLAFPSYRLSSPEGSKWTNSSDRRIHCATFNLHKDKVEKLTKNQRFIASYMQPEKYFTVKIAKDEPNVDIIAARDHFADIIKLYDRFIAIPSILFVYNHKEERLRREIYGKAGTYRLKPYGLEYRVLSNAWSWCNPLTSYIFYQARVLFDMVVWKTAKNLFGEDNLGTDYKKRMASVADTFLNCDVSDKEVRDTINNSDEENAKRIMLKFAEISLPLFLDSHINPCKYFPTLAAGYNNKEVFLEFGEDDQTEGIAAFEDYCGFGTGIYKDTIGKMQKIFKV